MSALPELKGMHIEDAKKAIEDAGMTYRIVSVNHHIRLITADYVRTRVNLHIENDHIWSWSIG